MSALADHLASEGRLPSDWRGTFERVRRDLFIPDACWRHADDGGCLPVVRSMNSGAWWDLVYRDEPVITQVDDGATPPGQAGELPTSSCPMPTMVLWMLTQLDLADHMRVLEIGTGTGYNAALMADRVGADNVVSVEVDEAVTGWARRALHAAGVCPRLVVGDGVGGYPAGAPFDRVIATCAVTRIPYSWVAQSRADGVIVTPWETAYGNGVLLRLDVVGDGTATGRVVGDTAFMWLRSQRLPGWAPREALGDGSAVRVSSTSLNPDDVFTDDSVDFVVGAAVPDCQVQVCDADDGSGEFTVWLYDPNTGSGASVDYEPGAAGHTIEQCGPRKLWDEIEAAYQWWIDAGRPERERFGLTVTPEEQQVWLDEPGRTVASIPR